MEKIPNKAHWNSCDSTMTHQLTATTYMTEAVYEVPLNSLPHNLQQMPGLKTVYVSGFIKPVEVVPSLSAIGELVALRTDNETLKAYNYIFGITDDSKILWVGPFKDFPDHHMKTDAVVPLANIFGQNPLKAKTAG